VSTIVNPGSGVWPGGPTPPHYGSETRWHTRVVSSHVDSPQFHRALAAAVGDHAVDPRLATFFDAVEREYNVRPVWAETDTVGPDNRPRLCVWVSHYAEALEFRHDREHFGNYDRARQRRLAELWAESLRETSSRWRVRRGPRRQVDISRLLVIVADVETPARARAHRGVPDASVDTWAESLGLADDLWTWQRLFGPPVVFTHTRDQADKWRASGAAASWAQAWAQLVKPYDPLGVVNAGDVRIFVDSKARFDEEFESSWFYFWR